MSIYKVRGVGGELEVFEDKVVITPKGVMGGLGGILSIPFGSITGIDHKKAGFVLPGHIMFQGGGVLAVKGGAKLDHRGGGKLDHPAVEWRG